MAPRLPLVRVSGRNRQMPSGDVVPVSAGGTGGSSASAARVNLGALDSGLPAMRNALINGGMVINQRAFAGGSLAPGVYGFDRWKAGSNGASVSVSRGTITLASGAIIQVVEADSAAYLAGKAVTFSVEDPSATVTVAAVFAATDTTSVSGTIASGSGRKGVTLTLPSGTGNLTITVSVSSSTTFKRMQLELGSVATGWDARSTAFELHLCQRYYWQGLPWASGINTPIYTSGGYQSFAYSFPVTMRTAPAMTISNSSWSTGNLNTNFGTNGVSVSPNINGFRILVQSSAAAANCYVDWSGGGYFAADAEL
ncbi:hypothetical protein SAMN02787149_101775 [Pseudomonas sp. Snoq117.2]|nr:hypothetical protein SAMN02787149_101775 [Pseudomonas sp. Snoq117.2]